MKFEPNIEKSQRLRTSIAPAPPPLGGLNFFIFFELNGLHGRIGHVI
jgi:hypothetical protein